jgi:hypothetical protein
MKQYGLPTYPINDGMVLGERDQDELEWLLDYGVIQSDLYRYVKIVKSGDGRYLLLKNKDDRYSNPDQQIAESSNLQVLIQEYELNIAYWYWYGHSEEGE